VILWSHNKKKIVIVKNYGILGTPLKQCHEAKNTNLNAHWNVKENQYMWKFNWLKAPNDIGTSPFPSIPHQLFLRWTIVIGMSRYLNGVTIK
jgi:hypothetical protein